MFDQTICDSCAEESAMEDEFCHMCGLFMCECPVEEVDA